MNCNQEECGHTFSNACFASLYSCVYATKLGKCSSLGIAETPLPTSINKLNSSKWEHWNEITQAIVLILEVYLLMKEIFKVIDVWVDARRIVRL